MAAYTAKFKTFLQFCVFVNISEYDNIHLILAFLQCLLFNGLSKASMENYLSALKYKYIMYDRDPSVFKHPKIALFLKSVAINRPLRVVGHNIIDLNVERYCSSL